MNLLLTKSDEIQQALEAVFGQNVLIFAALYLAVLVLPWVLRRCRLVRAAEAIESLASLWQIVGKALAGALYKVLCQLSTVTMPKSPFVKPFLEIAKIILKHFIDEWKSSKDYYRDIGQPPIAAVAKWDAQTEKYVVRRQKDGLFLGAHADLNSAFEIAENEIY